MIKLIKLLILLLFLNSCSSVNKFGLGKKDIKKNTQEVKIRKITPLSSYTATEFNSNVKIKIDSKIFNSSISKYTNNNKRAAFDGNLEFIKKYKFSKISNFDKSETNLVFDKDNIIYFQAKGTIIKFDINGKLIWEKNFYKKYEKKINPILFFASTSDILFVADNLSNYYAMNIDTGEMLWKKNNEAPFNSQIKIYEKRAYIIDYNNTIRCFSIQNGEEIWNYKTDKSLIRSKKKLSIAIQNNVILFNNSIGDVSALNLNGNLLWQRPTQNSLVTENSFLLKNSELVTHKKTLFFSNNNNEFYSLDIESGKLNWKQEISSILSPIIINDIALTVSTKGYLHIVDINNGAILRKTYLLDTMSKKEKKEFTLEGFIVTRNKIYLSSNKGYLLTVDLNTGKVKSYIKISKNKISRPWIINNSLYVVKNNSIIKFN